MNNKRPLVPAFIQRLDDQLLLHQPGVWSARTHIVAWFTFLYALVLSGFCYLAFFDTRQNSNIGGWVTFVILISFIGFVFWLIYLLRFSVFKRYGNWLPLEGLKTFLLYFLSVGMIVAVCFLPSAVRTVRANQQFGNEEIVKDINEMNNIICQLEINRLPKIWTPDTFELVKPIKIDHDTVVYSTDTTVTETTTVDAEAYRKTYRNIDSADLHMRLANADSVVKINNSLYVFYECPVYVFISVYGADEFTTTKLLRSADLYHTIIQPHRSDDTKQLQQKLSALKDKYSSLNDYITSSGIVYESDYSRSNSGYEYEIRSKYQISFIDTGLRNVVQSKYEWKKNWEGYLRVFYYFTMVLTLLVFIFRHTTVRTFFLTLLAAVILAIITGLLTVVSNGNETTVFSFIVVFYVSSLLAALSVRSDQKRSAVQGIGLNLFVFATPFMPLVFVAINEAMRRSAYDYPYKDAMDYKQQAFYYLIAEIAGGIIFLILIEPVFRKIYRKWFAAPEE